MLSIVVANADIVPDDVSASNPYYYTIDKGEASEENVQVRKPRFFCLPVMKEREGGEAHDIMNADDHLAVYDISPKEHQRGIEVKDQFEEHSLQVIQSVLLAVPTEKQAAVAHEN